jgi:predicted nucleic acid-binding protein
MDTYVDSSVLLDLIGNDPVWADWSDEILNRWRSTGNFHMNPIVYSNVSIGFERVEEMEVFAVLGGLVLRPSPREALFLAGKAFVKYRRRGGKCTTSLPDFLIGAQAAVAEVHLLTRDPRRICRYFPTVEIISPTRHFTDRANHNDCPPHHTCPMLSRYSTTRGRRTDNHLPGRWVADGVRSERSPAGSSRRRRPGAHICS